MKPHCARLIAVAALLLAMGCSRHAVPASGPVPLTVSVPAGRFLVDLYLPASDAPVPLVVIAHGFWRTKANMRGWGEHLAAQGLAAAVPTLPAWADHARNAQAIVELIDHLGAHPPDGAKLDTSRVGLLGFSAGGLATFLAASERPDLKIWVGLDPVDRDRQAVRAADEMMCPAVVLRAEPSSCNAGGNWSTVDAIFPAGLVLKVKGATHSDCEWPVDALAQVACGKSDPDRQRVFIEYATAALRRHLLPDARDVPLLDRALRDPRVTVIRTTSR